MCDGHALLIRVAVDAQQIDFECILIWHAGCRSGVVIVARRGRAARACRRKGRPPEFGELEQALTGVARGGSEGESVGSENQSDSHQEGLMSRVGNAYAKKIIANRPYKGNDELISKNVIREVTYNGIAGQVIAKQPAART
jgi:hypothetical protein